MCSFPGPRVLQWKELEICCGSSSIFCKKDSVAVASAAPSCSLTFLFQYILACAATSRTSSAPGGFLWPLTPVLPSTNDWQDLADK